METIDNKLCFEGIPAEKLIERFGSPLFVYEERKIREQCKNLQKAITYSPKILLYACKANSNPSLMRIIKEEGFGIDAASPEETYLASELGFDTSQIIYTGDNTTDKEMSTMSQDILINMGSLSQLKRYGERNDRGKSQKIALRLNLDIGAGHHDNCKTGGPESKFGIYYDKADEAKDMAEKYNLKITGLHQHIGSGILNPYVFKEAMQVMFKTAETFPDLEFIDCGGGIGIPYSPDDKEIDINEFGREVSKSFSDFCEKYGRKLRLILEPGRYLVAEAGTLLTTVIALKETPLHKFAGTDSGFNHLIRHTMYQAYHGIINASNVKDKTDIYRVTGNLCESGDLFSHGRDISRIREGDILAIEDAGAYGFSMSSNYNLRCRPAEVLITNSRMLKVIRERESFMDLMRGTELDRRMNL